MIFVVIQLLALCIWILIGWAIFRYLAKLKEKKQITKITRICIGMVLFGVWLGWPFWEISGKKMYYDARVDKMCVKDGGIRVFEKVTLPATKFNNYEKRNWLLPENNQASDDEYYVKTDKHYYMKGRINLSRRQYVIIRREDEKILGELVIYGRGGGDIPGPWHASSYSCPSHNKLPNFETSIFVKGDTK